MSAPPTRPPIRTAPAEARRQVGESRPGRRAQAGVARLLVAALVAAVVTGLTATGLAATATTSSGQAAEPVREAPAREAPAPATAAPAGLLPTTRTAPYVDLTTPPLPDLAAAADATGQRDMVLAFVLADGRSCTPTWGGTRPIADAAVGRQVAALKRGGGTPTVSSGGALGDYLETRCPDAASLAGAYGRALDAVGADHLDVDVETDRGRAVPLRRVAEALAQLQRERGTRVTLTVQVASATEGMTADALALVREATAAGVVARVNLMVMNFPDPGDWAEAMLGAARAAEAQLRTLWPTLDDAAVATRTGLTPMIGRNDTDATTTLADAARVVDGARRAGYGFVGFWSLARDNGGCPGTSGDGCSGVAQDRWAFTRAIAGFTARS